MATAGPINDWSLNSLKEKPIKIGAVVARPSVLCLFSAAAVALLGR